MSPQVVFAGILAWGDAASGYQRGEGDVLGCA